MRWKTLDSLERDKQWHRWFAWYPVTICGERVWFETVERKRGFTYRDGDFDWEYQWPIPEKRVAGHLRAVNRTLKRLDAASKGDQP